MIDPVIASMKDHSAAYRQFDCAWRSRSRACLNWLFAFCKWRTLIATPSGLPQMTWRFVLALILGSTLLATLGCPTAFASEKPAATAGGGKSTWRGIYFGANVGGGAGGGAYPTRFIGGELPNFVSREKASGPLGGVQAGYNYTFGGLLAGIEADWQNANLAAGNFTVGMGTAVAGAFNRSALEWFGTVRARLGIELSPSLLAYGTAGFAYGGGSSFSSYRDGAGGEGESSNFPLMTGFAAGAGLAKALGANWSVKLEYLYLNLDRSPGLAVVVNRDDPDDGGTIFAFPPASIARFHMIRAGFNYRFPLSEDSLVGGAETERGKDMMPEDNGTHYIFGYTFGSDVEKPSKGELESFNYFSAGKRPATSGATVGGQEHYLISSQAVEFEHSLDDRRQYSVGIVGLQEADIRHVAGFSNENRTHFGGVYFELRYQLQKRRPDFPIGAAISIEPHWDTVSEFTGKRETSFLSENRFIIDAELLKDRLYAGVNLLYIPTWSREAGENRNVRLATLGLNSALTYYVTPSFSVGAGLQYYQRYDRTVGLTNRVGESLYIGPHFYYRLNERTIFSAAFAPQVRGHAIGENHALDLSNFTRYLAKIHVGMEF